MNSNIYMHMGPFKQKKKQETKEEGLERPFKPAYQTIEDHANNVCDNVAYIKLKTWQEDTWNLVDAVWGYRGRDIVKRKVADYRPKSEEINGYGKTG